MLSSGVDGLNSFISVEPYSRPGNPNLGAAWTPPGAGAPVTSTVRALNLCYNFNKKDGCSRKDCRFKHACSYTEKRQGKEWCCMDASHNKINHK